MEIVHYPHPTLRHESKPVRRVDKRLKKLIDEMFDLMYEASGVGLAANQVDLPLQLFIMNPAGERGDGEEHVFLNPVLSKPKGSEEKQEGCLSLPELYGNVIRPKEVHCQAYNLKGEEFNEVVDGLFGRIIQHETDHLHGILFIDRMKESTREQVEGEVQAFESEFNALRRSGNIPTDDEILGRISEWESEYA